MLANCTVSGIQMTGIVRTGEIYMNIWKESPHARYSDTWDAGGTLGKSEHILDCLSKVAKLDITDCRVRILSSHVFVSGC